MVLASFLASWSFGLNVWPFSQFVLWPLLHIQRPKYKLEKRPNIEAKRLRGQKREAKRPRGQNGTTKIPNTKPQAKKHVHPLQKLVIDWVFPINFHFSLIQMLMIDWVFLINFHFSLNPAYRGIESTSQNFKSWLMQIHWIIKIFTLKHQNVWLILWHFSHF